MRLIGDQKNFEKKLRKNGIFSIFSHAGTDLGRSRLVLSCFVQSTRTDQTVLQKFYRIVKSWNVAFGPERYFRIFDVIFEISFVFNISALAGILLKSGSNYFFFRTIFWTIWIIQIFCSAVSVSERFKFNSSAMERASGNYPFVCWRHWDEASACS